MLVNRTSYSYWLRGKRKDDVVGNLKEFQNCPISNYIKESKDCLSILIRNDYIIAVPKGNSSHIEENNPKWLKDYLRELDIAEQQGVKNITAGEALRILKSC